MGSWGEQYSTGEQYRDSREAFWAGGFKTCCSCGKQKITSKTDCAGCRKNGDGYGTEVFTCQDCGWETSFQYDEASSPYYYETQYWGKNAPPPPRPRSPTVMTEDRRKTFMQMKKIAPHEAVAIQMRTYGYSEETITQLLNA